MRNDREVRLFDDEDLDLFPLGLFGFPNFKNDAKLDHAMRTDIKENENNFTMEMELAGYDKQNIEIGLKDGYLTVSAERHENNDEKDSHGNFIRRERKFGKVSRSFFVGKTIKESDIDAKLEHGILTIIIPKKQPEIEQPKKILIK